LSKKAGQSRKAGKLYWVRQTGESDGADL